MKTKLESITLKGFKTIRELDEFRPGQLTVLIGPNGAGKSNFISFFRMLNLMLTEPDQFQNYVAEQGGASKLLHHGPDVTPQIEATLTIETDSGRKRYHFRLFFAASDTLIFADEKYGYFHQEGPYFGIEHLGRSGHRSAQLPNDADTDSKIALAFLDFLGSCKVYQFHNTSTTARIRTKWHFNDNHFLKEDGGNIAPLLYRLKRDEKRCYRRIVDTLQLILPFFSDFVLGYEYEHMLLAWRERGSDLIFDVSQASDGMLRIIALVTLLLLPDERLPDLLIIDEPELGLHPYAINIIGGLVRAASQKTQVIVATQSTAFVDCFEPSDIVVVEREGRASTFRRLEDNERLREWLEEYSLSELWQKNVIGGRP